MVTTRRTTGFLLPAILILGGALILLANLGTLPQDAGWRILQLWPLILVAIGVELLVPHLVQGAAAIVLALALVLVIALGGFVYALAGPSMGSASYVRFQSTSPVAGVREATLRIDDAADQVTITSRDLGDQLYQAKIDYVGSAPGFAYGNGDVTITRSSNFFNSWGRARDVIQLDLNQSVAWTVVMDGAGTTTRIDLSGGRLQSFHLNGAGCNVTLIAGAPHSAVTVAVDGVGIQLNVQVPAGTDYRITADGVGTSVDGVAQTSGWSAAADRYDISLNGVGAHAAVATSG